MEGYTRFLDKLFGAIRWITVVLLSLMVAVETYEISMRTITGDTPAWSKELVLLSMVWMGCLGSAVLHRERGHITIEAVTDRFPPGAKKTVMIAGDFAVCAFSAFLIVAGTIVVGNFIGQTLPGTDLPVGLSYLPLPVTGALLCLAGLEHFALDLASAGDDQEAAKEAAADEA